MFLTHPRKHGAENLSLVSNVLLLFYLQLLVHKFHISTYSKKYFHGINFLSFFYLSKDLNIEKQIMVEETKSCGTRTCYLDQWSELSECQPLPFPTRIFLDMIGIVCIEL